MNNITVTLKALNNDNRLQILQWLKNPKENFPPQIDGDLVKDGVCSGTIADKLGVSAPALTAHMRILSEAGLVKSVKKKGWVFYQRDEAAIKSALRNLSDTL